MFTSATKRLVTLKFVGEFYKIDFYYQTLTPLGDKIYSNLCQNDNIFLKKELKSV